MRRRNEILFLKSWSSCKIRDKRVTTCFISLEMLFHCSQHSFYVFRENSYKSCSNIKLTTTTTHRRLVEVCPSFSAEIRGNDAESRMWRMAQEILFTHTILPNAPVSNFNFESSHTYSISLLFSFPIITLSLYLFSIPFHHFILTEYYYPTQRTEYYYPTQQILLSNSNENLIGY